MSKLDGLRVMENVVKIYVPTTTDVDQVTDTTVVVTHVLEVLSQTCGGATAQEGIGAWVSDTVGLIQEKVTICFAYIVSLTDKIIDIVVSLAQEIKNLLHQEAVAMEVNGKLYLV